MQDVVNYQHYKLTSHFSPMPCALTLSFFLALSPTVRRAVGKGRNSNGLSFMFDGSGDKHYFSYIKIN